MRLQSLSNFQTSVVKPRFGADRNLFIDVFQELVNEAEREREREKERERERSKRSKEYVTVKIKLQLGQLCFEVELIYARVTTRERG